MGTAVDPTLKQFGTTRQIEVVDAVNTHGSTRKAAKALGCHHGSVDRALRSLRERAALKGYAPHYDMTKITPDPFVVKGTSTYYGKDGDQRGQWVKTSLDHQRRLEMINEAFAEAARDLPRLPRTPAPKQTNAQLCNVFTLTDCHIGMLAWHREGGADWDLKIAEETLVGSFVQMMRAAPTAETAVIAQLGDFLHYDGLAAVTPTSGHNLDADGRFGKMIRVAIRVLRTVVALALEKHKHVTLVIAEGNHDLAGSAWLREMFLALYENEPRLTVIDTPLPYYALQHGKTMIGWHHSHLKRMEQLPLLMATQFAVIWGATTFRYCHSGDKHHTEEKEYSGMIATQHPTLAARDAYAARHGWHALRRATVFTYHSEFGEVGRTTVTPEMLTTKS